MPPTQQLHSSPEHDLFNISPLTSPDQAPFPSPSTTANENALPSHSDNLNLDHMPPTRRLQSSSKHDLSALEEPPAKRRATKKNASSHRRRAKKRSDAKAAYGSYQPNSRLLARHVSGTDRIVCDLEATAVENVASTGFVGLDDGSRSKTLFTLEQLVGEGSRFSFRLHRWDGRCVFVVYDSSPLSLTPIPVPQCPSSISRASPLASWQDEWRTPNGPCSICKPVSY